jgi:hypothetical protein
MKTKTFKCNCGMCKTKLSILKLNDKMLDIGIVLPNKEISGVVLYEKDIKKLKEFLNDTKRN